MPKPAQTTSARKRVIVESLDGKLIPGFLGLSGLGRAESLDLLSPDGEHVSVSAENVRCVYVVKDFAGGTGLSRKTFVSRPKVQGLWVQLNFRDGDILEGILPNNLADPEENGLIITPADLTGNCQRIFIPKSSLEKATVLGVIGAIRRPAARPAPTPSEQQRLFEEGEG